MKIFTSLMAVSILTFFGVGQVKSQSQSLKEVSVQSKNQILYLFFKISKDQSGLEKISLNDQKIVNGKMKSMPAFNENELENGDLIITLYDRSGKEIYIQNAKNPLNPELESFGDEMGRHKLTLQESEFSFRFPHFSEINFVKIEKFTNSKKHLLFTQNL
ncbi:hypothetical protein [Chryseobacterium chendengshani]|uniref:hypothetical protein n=1 Tax=Chryseobacterium sp. LJ756 TaxID=2864113 RepID=UPI001C63EB48|nr:hypothetical protein [Chryseobacterium sp. LJ756]MBW7675711.1 hypothetical protein [Chryseobacterium sp. LJ756]